ncbi:hypothetical protein DB30_02067 [Enhygromyxa salina]|uniref:Uncharacterized protein n=1 Tax=Enhygromyxa salina TaxID=215803 RepID=A0A0C2CQS8_9BACT|nr:hypothetical protein DB30_02067 [Enhygromyxa salina]
MPGKLHQGTLELFRDDPWLAFDLLGIERPTSGTPKPRQGEVECEDPEHPDKVVVRYPDLVLVYDVKGEPGIGIVIGVEAQGGYAYIKRWRLPYYQAVLADTYKLPTWMVVVSYNQRMSAAIREWMVGLPPRVDVLLLDVDTVPKLSLERAQQWPTAAALVAAVHGHHGDIEAAQIGVHACMRLPEKQRKSYIGTILAALSVPERDTLKRELNMEEKEEIWEIERNSGTYMLGREHGRQEGREHGRREAFVELVLALLEVRGVECDAASEARIRACEEHATLERWGRRAREVTHASALFEDA